MFHRWAALVLVLALCAMSPKNAAGQTQSQVPRGPGAGKLGRAFPNPFNPRVFIPFTVVDADGNCTDGREIHVVSVRILNILAAPVAIPILDGPAPNSTTSIPSALKGASFANLKIGCGAYLAYWDGNLQGTTKEAASGIYVVQFFVDGKLVDSKRIYNRK
ncbi:MAG TPA: hypothetical protein VK636_05980 [Gemmatimonadaceae bacterium]|nr:hypothetical protein [Gemmatimonadaceae bacterium]